MNQRNVEALRSILMFLTIRIGYEGEVDIDTLAADLAAAGVLAPAALTDDEAASLDTDNYRGPHPTMYELIAAEQREKLTRLAQGRSLE